MSMIESKEALLTQAIESHKQIQALYKERQRRSKSFQAQKYHLKYGVFGPKIQALEDTSRKAIDQLEDQEREEEETQKAQIAILKIPVQHIERIISFLKMEPKDLTIDDNDIHVYNDKFKENLRTIFQDEHLHIKLYIVENRKPKNKYSLVAYGKSDISLEELWQDNYSYGIDAYEHDRYSLRVCLRDAPRTEELKTFASFKLDSIIQKLLGNYFEVKKEYVEARQNYQLEDFALWEQEKEKE